MTRGVGAIKFDGGLADRTCSVGAIRVTSAPHHASHPTTEINMTRSTFAVAMTALVCFSGFDSPSLTAQDQPVVQRAVEPAEPGLLIDDVDPDNPAIAKQKVEIPKEITKWEDDIAKLEKLDAQSSDPPGAILFIGSSSVRRWTTIDEDMAPYLPIRRGYGGARYRDLAHFATRLIRPHDYRAIVMFVANDVSGGDNDATVDQIEGWVDSILDVAQQHSPGKPVFIIEITPAPKRWSVYAKIRQVNDRLREICLTRPDTYFIETAEHYLDRHNQPVMRFFDDDRLHLSDEGYDLWSKLIRRKLDDVFRDLALNDQEAADLSAQHTGS
ncbi:hypothetical protein Pan14r_42280 [Crateriforma conspicua]|uniref:SGNH hydrolase-type esterase domain-containing protein n=2 Tax=Crateriforma conspicua TaxID=2527996 RepID=A0A5C5YBU8_9PLAN|nr:hypothetical protein Pan14r_42280 [Crateriforma conspicua]